MQDRREQESAFGSSRRRSRSEVPNADASGAERKLTPPDETEEGEAEDSAAGNGAAEADEVAVVEDVDAFAETRYYKNVYKPIDAAGSLPDGTRFTGPAGLKRALLDRRHRVA